MGWRETLARSIMPRETKGASSTDEMSALFKTITGITPAARNMAQLIAAYKQVPQFRSVVSKIADHVAAADWRLYAVKSGKKGKDKEYLKTHIGSVRDHEKRSKELSRHRDEGALEEIVDHPLLDLIHVSNDLHTGFETRRLMQIYLDIVGESFEHMMRDSMGMPIQTWIIPPQWVRGVPSSKKPWFELVINGGTFKIPPEDMLWTRDLDPLNPYSRGSGIAESLSDEIDTSDYAAKYVKSFFYNRAKPDLIMSIEDAASGEDVQRASQAFEQLHRGYGRAHRTFWHKGKLKVTELNTAFNDLGIVDLQVKNRDDFIQTYGVPPEILGITKSSNKATSHEAKRLFTTETVVPRLERIRSKRQQHLVKEYDDRVILHYDSPVPDDEEAELAAMVATPYNATRGEWRRKQGLIDRGEYDNVHLMPVNLIPQPGPTIGSKSVTVVAVKGLRDDREPVLLTQKTVGAAEVENALEALRPEVMRDALGPIHRENMASWGDDALEELGVSVSFEIINPLTATFFDEWEANKIGKINETTRKALNKTLIEGVRAGEGVRDLSKRVTEEFAAAKGYRAERIARTEVLGASNHATHAAHVQSGVVASKQWVATPDGRVRDEHAELGGIGTGEPQIVPLGEPFVTSDGWMAMYPGDFGAAEMDINCRCLTIAVIGEPHSAKQLGDIWKVFDKALIPWERAIEEAAKRAFDEQRDAVLRALRAVMASV